MFILSPLAYYLYANNIRSLQSLRFFVWWFILVGGIFIVMHFTGIGIPLPLNAGGQFSTWVGMFCVGQITFNKTHKPYLKVILIMITVAWLFQIIGSGRTWLSGWVPFLVSVLILTVLRSRKLFVLLLIAGAVFVLADLNTINQTLDAENKESGESRSEAWSEALNLTKDHLLFGTGPAGYYMYYTVNGFHTQLSHNNYIDIIAQTGVVGAVVYLWFWIAIGFMAIRTYRNAPRGGFHQALAASLLAANAVTFTSMMLGDWVTPFAYIQGIGGIDYTIWHWMMAGLTAALYHETRVAQKKDIQILETSRDSFDQLALSNRV
jgi:O-antigen ligase